MVEVFISRIGFDASTETFVVILKEKSGDRVLAIWIGRPEAESIVMRIHNIKHARPLTHDLCKSVITTLGARLERVQITHVAESTFFAELHLDVGGARKIVDARPSDSIAVALRMDAPIYAADDLLSDPLNDDDEAEPNVESSTGPRPSGEGHRLTADELKAYLEKLRPEDFGDFQP
jgi:bifunctional DNase/RNase